MKHDPIHTVDGIETRPQPPAGAGVAAPEPEHPAALREARRVENAHVYAGGAVRWPPPTWARALETPSHRLGGRTGTSAVCMELILRHRLKMH